MSEGTNLIWQPFSAPYPRFTWIERDKPLVRDKANAVMREVYGWPHCLGGVGATLVVRAFMLGIAITRTCLHE